MKLFQLLFSLCLVFTLSVHCSIPQPEGSVPDAVKASFKAKYPDVKDVSWGKDSHGYYEAKYKKNDEKYRADFEESGKWIETEANIKYKDLPDAVQEAIKREYDKDDITEIEQVEHYQKGIFYDVEIDEKGKKRIDVEYDALGRVIGGE